MNFIYNTWTILSPRWKALRSVGASVSTCTCRTSGFATLSRRHVSTCG